VAYFQAKWVLETVRKSVRRALGCTTNRNLCHDQNGAKSKKKVPNPFGLRTFPNASHPTLMVEISGIEPLTFPALTPERPPRGHD
jgi:hypothetical protein